MNQSWLYNGKQIQSVDDLPEGKWMGFVYLITCLVDNRKYVGKKLLTFASTRQVKGKKKRVRVASDWLEYYGSSDELKADVEKLGPDKFHREILHLCSTKGECNYLEAREQFDRRVLESDDYYNGQIQCRIHQTHIKRLRDKSA